MSRKELRAVGSQRESLSTNPLLIQSQVGKIKSRCFSLPPADFTYGIDTIPLGGGVAEAVTCWKYHKDRGKGKDEEEEKDFIKLNKGAIQAGLTTAHEHQTYRAIHDIRRRRPDRSQTVPAVPDIVFGIQTRPSTPIYDLLENKYQEKWLAEMREKDKQTNIKVMSRKGKIYETRTSLLRRYLEPVDPPPYWKMKRWSKIPGELETFRTDKGRSDAFKHHASDRTSRLGLLGQGIYQEAKS